MPSAQKKGFTLIELLVVIVIIAILATIGLVMYGSAQKSARVSKRIQDLKAIQTALELHYTAKREYPKSPSWTSCNTSPSGIVPTYMPAWPKDPGNGCYYYASTSTGSEYKLRANCASVTGCDMQVDDYKIQLNLIDPARDSSLTNSGTKCSEVDATNYAAWAVFSTNTGSSDGGAPQTPADNNNPACW